MDQARPDESNTAAETRSADGDSFRKTWSLLRDAAWPYRHQFAWVALLSLLATAASLVEPMIYRAAINDISGLFVGQRGERGIDSLLREALGVEEEGDASQPGREGSATREPKGHTTPLLHEPPSPSHRAREPHRRGHVAPRTPEQALRTLLIAVVLLFVVDVVSYGLTIAADQRTTRLAGRIEASVIQRTFGHVLMLPLSFFSRRTSGGLAKQIDQSDQIAPIVTAFSHEIVPHLLTMVGVAGIMLFENWQLTLVALLTLPPYLWVVYRSSARLETGLEEYWEMWEGVSARIQDALGAIKTVKLSGAEQREVDRLSREAGSAYESYIQRNRLANRYSFWQDSLGYLSEALVLGYGGWLVLEHRLTPGDVVMFVAYLGMLYDPIEELTSTAVTLQENMTSVRRATRLLDTGGEERGGEALRPGPGVVEFRDVHFGYVPEREVLKGVSFELRPGKVTALVGPSGAGKTTAADLLLHLFEPQRGEIRIDGQNLAALDPASLRRAVGVVAVDGAIFRGSVAENIRYKRADATDEEVRAAALAAGLARTLERLPDGLATTVGEHGVGLSVGERQRIQIARVLVSRPRILVLDEATANIDYATENEIRSALLERPDRPTTLVIAHRYSMVRDADFAVVLDAGEVVESGTVAELIAAGGWFSRFSASAQDDSEDEADEETDGECEEADEAEEEEDDELEAEEEDAASDGAEPDEEDDEGDEVEDLHE